MDLSDWRATDLRAAIAKGAISPTDVVRACIDRVEQIDGCVNALVTRSFDRALAEATEAEAAIASDASIGPLTGIPVAIKDIQATAGVLTTYGSQDFADNVPTDDAPIVARIRRAGGIVIGKTNVPEHSIGANTVNRLFGATGNPFDVTRTCGGSSGGSAVALATHMAPLATGSDHGGSLRIPASFCGVVGYRATPAVVPNEGRTVTQTNYSVQGPMARCVDDVALLMSVLLERDSASRRDPMAYPIDAQAFERLQPIDPREVRIRASADLGGLLVSKSIQRSFNDRLPRIARLVGSLEAASIDLRDAPGVDWHLRQELFLGQYHRDAADWDEGFNPNVRATYEAALETSFADYAEARRRQMELTQHCSTAIGDADVLICPGVAVSPFPWTELNPRTIDGTVVENYMAWLQLTASLTVVGHPVVALPCGLDEYGMPFGIQVVGRPHMDHHVLSVAAALERAFADDEMLKRPAPDLAQLAVTQSECRAYRP